MTDVQFLSNNSTTCEANRVKCETLMQDSWAYKSPLTILEIGHRVCPCGQLFTKSGYFCHFGGRIPTPVHRLA